MKTTKNEVSKETYSNDSWIKETLTTIKGDDFKITTQKKLKSIVSTFARVERLNNGGYKETLSFKEDNIILKDKISEDVDYNNFHLKSLVLFDQLIEHKEKVDSLSLEKKMSKQNINSEKDIINLPEGIKSIIVAEYFQDDSDSMTDYFNTSKIASKRIYLAYSFSKRNNMRELEKACLNCETTKAILEDETTVKYRSGHSYLPDFFIGSERWSGYKITKLKNFDLSKEENKNSIYTAVAEGRFFCTELVKEKSIKTTGNVEIIDYSEKAFAVVGEGTKILKEELKELGGKFNFRLKCGAGWIFSKKKLDEVQLLIGV